MNLQTTLADKLNGRRIGNYYACWCPFDSHRKPALLLYKDYFICKSCDEQGPLDKLSAFLAKKTWMVPRKAAKSSYSTVLPRWKKWIAKYDDLDGIADIAHRMLTPQKAGYLKKRKMDRFIEQGYFGILDGWLVLPVFNQDREIIDIVVRAICQKTDAKYVITPSKDGHRPLYVPNWERVIKADTVYVPFGIFDAWAFEAIELAAVTGITGKTINPAAFEALKNKRKVIVPDYNEWTAAYKLQQSLGSLTEVLRLPYEYGIKDCDDFRLRLSPSEWKGMVLGDWT